MQEVKNKSIRISKNLWLLLLLLAPYCTFAQYSLAPVQRDTASLHIDIEKQYFLAPISINGIKVDRTKMPIFCKWELDIQDQSKIPIKFRLGSQDYVDRLEQKHHY